MSDFDETFVDEAASMKGRYRSIVFTINNWTEEDKAMIRKFTGIKYAVVGDEVAPTTGTPHLQGYIQFENSKAFAVIRKALPRAWFKKARADGKKNRAYCTKMGAFFEIGECPPDSADCGLKEKEKWADILALAKLGDTAAIDELYPKESLIYDKQISRKRVRPTPTTMDGNPHDHFIWLYGPSGYGKSHQAEELVGPGRYEKGSRNKWWDDYQYEDSVLIPDFSKYDVHMGSDLKNWCDLYPIRVEAKHGSLVIRPKLIVITSNWKIEEIWGEDPQTVGPLLRKIKQVKAKCTNPDHPHFLAPVFRTPSESAELQNFPLSYNFHN